MQNYNQNQLKEEDYKKISDITKYITKRYPKNVFVRSMVEPESLETTIELIHTKNYPEFKRRFGEEAFQGWLNYYIDSEDYEICSQMIK